VPVTGREDTPEGDAAVEAPRFKVDREDYLRRINATTAPVAFIDLSFHPDKSISTAYALARSPAERGLYRAAVAAAAADTMAYFEREMGHVRRGHNGSDGTEPGKLAWATVMHDTARPVLETAERDKQGRGYTEYHAVPQVADPHLHPHVLCLAAVMTEGGHVGAIDLDRLNGLTKQFGAVFHVYLAQRLRAHGAAVRLDKDTGAAVLTDVSRKLCREFSKRTTDARGAAAAFAKQQGLDWDSLPKDRQIALLHREIEGRRLAKDQSKGDFAQWGEQAQAIDPAYRSPLRRHRVAEPLTQERRVALAVEIAGPLIAARLEQEAVLPEAELRELLIRGFVETGMARPEQDITAAVALVRAQGIQIGTERTTLIFGLDSQVRGKTMRCITTALAETQERETIELARTANADRGAALPRQTIDRHVAATGVPYTDEQRSVINRFAGGGRLEVAIGVAGTGKTTLLAPVVSAWREAGRDVHGVAQKWSHASALAGAGIEPDRCVALDKMLHDARAHRVELTRESVIVVDEIARVGVRQWRELLQVREQTGCQIVALGDPRQCPAIERGNVVDLVSRALPDAIPEMLRSIRQRTDRERDITAMFRDGTDIERALAMKQEDGSFALVPAGVKPTIDAVVERWAERTAANKHDPAWSITVSAPTNADVHAINQAIRRKRQALGEIGPDQKVIRAIDKNARHTFSLALSVGDKVRVFDRVFDADQKAWPRRAIGSNGDVLEVRGLSERGMLVRNADGMEGMIEWRKLRGGQGEPVRPTLGYTHTIDSIQGQTSSEHISAYPSGTAKAPLGKHYTALSRQRDCNWLIVNESAERQQVYKRARWTGTTPIISHGDVVRNVAANMSRFQEKAGAVDFLSRSVREGKEAVLVALEPAQRRQREGMERSAVPREHAVRRLRQRMEMARPTWEHVTQAVRRGIERTRQAMRPTRGPQQQAQEIQDKGRSAGPGIEL